jgi:hypothetical protein
MYSSDLDSMSSPEPNDMMILHTTAIAIEMIRLMLFQWTLS